MEADECYFKSVDKCLDESNQKLVTAGPVRIQTIIKCSKQYGDGIHVALEEELRSNNLFTIQTHRNCLSTYTSKTQVTRSLKHKSEQGSSTFSPKRRRSDTPNFNFQQHCLFCGEDCIIQKDPKNPSRWRRAYLCRSLNVVRGSSQFDLKSDILDVCKRRNDAWANLVRIRIEGAISDLHAADARYHVDCKVNFMSNKSIKGASALSSHASGEECDEAFNQLISNMVTDKARIWNSVELYDQYLSYDGTFLSRTQLLNKLSIHFDDDLLILTAIGVASIVVFRSKAPTLLKLVNDSDESCLDNSIKRLVKQIKLEVKDIDIDKKHYNTDITIQTLEDNESGTLMSFLSNFSPNLDRTLPAHLVGNIITSSLTNYPTHLQVSLGILMRDSKKLIQQMNEFGITCTYDEVLRFKKSAAVAATSSPKIQGISDCSKGLVQTVVDNFDANISSQNGKLSTHSLAVLVAQTPTVEQEDINTNTIQRLPFDSKSDSINYDVNVQHYSGPKKPKMPKEKSSKAVLPLKILAGRVVSMNRAKETDLCFFQDMLEEERCPEYNGYNTKLSREQGHAIKPHTRAVYLQLIDMTPSDPDTIMTALCQAQSISRSCGQEFTIFTADLQLYRVAVNILWAYPDQFSDVILRLGGMHTLMSFVGSVGTLMAASGLEELLESTFGGVAKMLCGKKFPQNVRALRIVAEELLRPIFSEYVFHSMLELDNVLEDLCRKGRMSKLWIDCLIKPVFIMMMFIRAEREGDWGLHLDSLKRMIPYFFAAGHVNYARYGLYYLRSMEAMPENIQEKFQKGEHVMRHISGQWNSIWSDMFIETTFMRYGHGKGGIIGITLKPETLKVWALSLHICCKIEQGICQLNDDESDNLGKHKEEMEGRITSDQKDRDSIRKKLSEIIHPLKPESHTDELFNIANGNIASSIVNVDRAVELGTEEMSKFESSWPESFDEKIGRCVKTQAESKKFVKVGEAKVYDTDLIYSRVIGLQLSREIDINEVLAHELAPVPTSMFMDTGEMRTAKSKSVLKQHLQKEVSSRQTVKGVKSVIIDGSAILYVVHWPVNGTVNDFILNFRRYIERKLTIYDVYLVFDRYRPYSIKSVTRSARGAGSVRVHQMSATMPLPSQKVVLSQPENKQQLIALICEDLLSNISSHRRLVITGEEDVPTEITNSVQIRRGDIKTSHEEADNILAQQMVDVSKETKEGVSVISDDTDVFVLLLHHYAQESLSGLVLMESPVQDRSVIDIGRTAKDLADIIPDLLAAHALSGCDTVGCYFGIGKATVVKVLRSHKLSLSAVGDQDSDIATVVKQSTQFISACYGRSDTVDMSETRRKVWVARVAKSNSTAPKLCSLPPTTEAFVENAKRAHLQACIWKHALEADPPSMDPVQYGWLTNNETKSCDPVMVATGVQLAPTEVLKMIKCACGSETPCISMRCRCARSKLPCTIFCGCQGGLSCYNEQTVKLNLF